MTYIIVDVIDNKISKHALSQCDASNMNDAIHTLCDNCMIDIDDDNTHVREHNDTFILFDVDDDETFIIAHVDHMHMLYDRMFMN